MDSQDIPAHGFSEKVSSMGQKQGRMAQQLDQLGKDLSARVQSFGSTVAVAASAAKEKGEW
jgi:hypothetical protein